MENNKKDSTRTIKRVAVPGSRGYAGYRNEHHDALRKASDAFERVKRAIRHGQRPPVSEIRSTKDS